MCQRWWSSRAPSLPAARARPAGGTGTQAGWGHGALTAPSQHGLGMDSTGQARAEPRGALGPARRLRLSVKKQQRRLGAAVTQLSRRGSPCPAPKPTPSTPSNMKQHVHAVVRFPHPSLLFGWECFRFEDADPSMISRHCALRKDSGLHSEGAAPLTPWRRGAGMGSRLLGRVTRQRHIRVSEFDSARALPRRSVYCAPHARHSHTPLQSIPCLDSSKSTQTHHTHHTSTQHR